MKRTAMLLVMALLLLCGAGLPSVSHAADSSKPIQPGSTCISNSFLSAEVRNVTDSFNIGRYTFAKGGCPIDESLTNPNMILFPLGTSFNTVRVWDTNSDYVQGGSFVESPGFRTVNLDGESPVLQTVTPTLLSIGWSTSTSNLKIAQDIEVQGSSVIDSRIRMTVAVHNGDTVAHTVSLRNLLDGFIGDYDGTWIRLFNGTTSGPITGIEENFAPPYNFTAFQMSGCSSNPCTPDKFGTGTFSLFGSISSPPGSTVPSRFVYGWWKAMKSSAFNYTSVVRQIGSTVPNVDGSMDDGLLYFFGPLTLAPGQATSATIFLSNQERPILASGLTVSKFFTRGEAVDNLLPVDSNGNPKVDVVLANGVVSSVNPGEIRAWVNVTNTSTSPLESLQVNETLPVDWLAHPPYLPGKGAIHVLFANGSSIQTELTHSSKLSVSTSNPETVSLSVSDFEDTAVGHALMPGQSILLSVKLDYGLKGTNQAVQSYPRNYVDTASAAGWTQPSFTGSEVTGIARGLFVAYAKAVGSTNHILIGGILANAALETASGKSARWKTYANVTEDEIA